MASIETEDSQIETIQIQSNDGEIYTIDQGVVDQSTVLADFREMGVELIPLPNVRGSILGLVVEYCNHHKNDPKPERIDYDNTDDISEWDQNFIKRVAVNQGIIFEIILAANYLGIKSLIDVGCKTIANMLRGKSTDEMRKILNISSDRSREGSPPNEREEESH